VATVIFTVAAITGIYCSYYFNRGGAGGSDLERPPTYVDAGADDLRLQAVSKIADAGTAGGGSLIDGTPEPAAGSIPVGAWPALPAIPTEQPTFFRANLMTGDGAADL